MFWLDWLVLAVLVCPTNVFFVIYPPPSQIKSLFPLVVFQGQPENRLKFFSSNKTDIKHILSKYNVENMMSYNISHMLLLIWYIIYVSTLVRPQTQEIFIFLIMVRQESRHVNIWIFWSNLHNVRLAKQCEVIIKS